MEPPSMHFSQISCWFFKCFHLIPYFISFRLNFPLLSKFHFLVILTNTFFRLKLFYYELSLIELNRSNHELHFQNGRNELSDDVNRELFKPLSRTKTTNWQLDKTLWPPLSINTHPNLIPRWQNKLYDLLLKLLL